MKTKILVFPCGSEIGLEIYNSLKWSTHIELWGASTVSNHGKFVYSNYLEIVPNVDDPNFIEKLNSVIKKYNIDFIFPAHDSVILKLAENYTNIKCKVIGSPPKTCQICRSKKNTYEILKSIIDIPEIYKDTKNIKDYPVFLKPDVGQGSKGTFIASSPEEISFYQKMDSSLLVLEYLPGDEYTVDCFTDKDRKLRFSQARIRNRISNGISVNTSPINDEFFQKIAQKINNTLLFRGAWFFQLKRNKDDKLYLLEVGPRIAGSMALYRNLGVNFPLLSVFDALGQNIEIINNSYNIEMDRALFNRFNVSLKYSHVYIDLDDTIILNERINPYVIMFLYQCFNEKIKIHLLTKHESHFQNNTLTFLKKYRISEIFDSIENIKEDDNKANYIKEKNSIFIDDSFTERVLIYNQLKIPTFETSSIESLVNWKY